MAKAEPKAAHLDLRSLQDRLLLAALSRIAHVLRPYPKDVRPEDISEAVGALRQRRLVHGTDRQPNLTAAGVEAARTLAVK